MVLEDVFDGRCVGGHDVIERVGHDAPAGLEADSRAEGGIRGRLQRLGGQWRAPGMSLAKSVRAQAWVSRYTRACASASEGITTRSARLR